MTFEGTVKAFDTTKGFGFVAYEEVEIFCHMKQCKGNTPQVGDKVMFDLEESRSKPGTMQCSEVTGGTGAPIGADGKGGGKGGGGDGGWGGNQGWNGNQSWGNNGGGGGGDGGGWGGNNNQQQNQGGGWGGNSGGDNNSSWGNNGGGNNWGNNSGGGGGGGGSTGSGSQTGTVKTFNDEKGFGFITLASGDSVFFHRKQVVDGKTPQQGDTLQFDTEPSPNKEGQLQATKITGGTGEATKGKGKGKGDGKGKQDDSWGPAKKDDWGSNNNQSAPYGGNNGGNNGGSWGNNNGGNGGGNNGGW